MQNNFPSLPDWIQIFILLAIVATAMFTLLTALAANKQTAMLAPIVGCSASKGPNGLWQVSISLYPEDRLRYTLLDVKLVRPRSARMRRARETRDSCGGIAYLPDGQLVRSLAADPGSVAVEFFVASATPGVVEVRVKIALRSALRQTSRCTTFIRIKD